jgi:SAM-dependent methyltransferase
MPVPPATLRQRIDYGRRVTQLALGVLTARLRAGAARPDAPAVPYNTMFARDLLGPLEPHRRTLEAFDLYLFDIMNSVRLRGEKVFEYGTLLAAIRTWDGLRILDVGTGRSTLPQWMTHAGARVFSLDLPAPAEDRWGGFQERLNGLVARRAGPIASLAGSMRRLPFAADSFDLVTSLSVVEHLDTNLPDRAYVPYAEQCRRLAEVLDDAIRVTAPGGHIYLTSECCDFDRATTDAWRGSYYYLNGPALSGAWPVRDVPALFYDFVAARGCTLVGGIRFDAGGIADPDRWSFRGPFFSGFSLLARKDAR